MCKYVGVRLFTFTNLKNKVVTTIRVTLVIRRLQLKEEEINKQQKEKRRMRNGEASAEGSKQGQITALSVAFACSPHVCVASQVLGFLQTHQLVELG